MSLEFGGLSVAQRMEAVVAFDAHFGEMDRALWCLSRHCRADLLAGHSSEVVEALVWTLKSWWGVQGVRAQAKGQMAAAVVQAVPWSEELFGEVIDPGSGAGDFCL